MPCCADNAVASSASFVTVWRERLVIAAGSQGLRSWNRSLEGVRSSPCFNFALWRIHKVRVLDSGSTRIGGCSRAFGSVSGWKKQPVGDETFDTYHNGGHAVLLVTCLIILF